MRVVVTTCCAEKSKLPGLIPAKDRYLSKRIDSVLNEAKSNGVEFFILSGKYGLIHSNFEIPYYDEALLQNKVDDLLPLVQQQLKDNEIDTITFFGENPAHHKDWVPYYTVIERACEELSVSIVFIYL